MNNPGDKMESHGKAQSESLLPSWDDEAAEFQRYQGTSLLLGGGGGGGEEPGPVATPATPTPGRLAARRGRPLPMTLTRAPPGQYAGSVPVKKEEEEEQAATMQKDKDDNDRHTILRLLMTSIHSAVTRIPAMLRSFCLVLLWATPGLVLVFAVIPFALVKMPIVGPLLEQTICPLPLPSPLMQSGSPSQLPPPPTILLRRLLPSLDADGLRCRVDTLDATLRSLDLPPNFRVLSMLPPPSQLASLGAILGEIHQLELYTQGNESDLVQKQDQLSRRQAVIMDMVRGRDKKSKSKSQSQSQSQIKIKDKNNKREKKNAKASLWLYEKFTHSLVDCRRVGRQHLAAVRADIHALYIECARPMHWRVEEEAQELVRRLETQLDVVCAKVDTARDRAANPLDWVTMLSPDEPQQQQQQQQQGGGTNDEHGHVHRQYHDHGLYRSGQQQGKQVMEAKDALAALINLCSHTRQPLDQCRQSYTVAMQTKTRRKTKPLVGVLDDDDVDGFEEDDDNEKNDNNNNNNNNEDKSEKSSVAWCLANHQGAAVQHLRELRVDLAETVYLLDQEL